MSGQGKKELIGMFSHGLKDSLQEGRASVHVSYGKLPELDIGFYGRGSETEQLKPVTVFTVDDCIGACIQRPRENKGDFQKRVENVKRKISDQYPDQEGWNLLAGAVRRSLTHNWKGLWIREIHPIGED
jgi:hypothetical protein